MSSQALDLRIASIPSLDDAHEALDGLRDVNPVLHLPSSDAWLISGYHELRTALSSPEFTAELGDTYTPHEEVRRRTNRESPLTWFTRDPLLRGNTAQLSAVRRCLTRVLSPNACERYVADIDDVVRKRLSELVSVSELDLYADFALQVSTDCVRRLLAIPGASDEDLRRYSRAFVKIMSPDRTPLESAALNAAIRAFRGHANDILESEGYGGGPVVRALVQARLDLGLDQELTTDDLARMLITLIAVGTQSVAAAVSQALITFYASPAAREQLEFAGDRPRLLNWILESMRHRLFILFMVRYTTRPVELGGVAIPKGATVWLSPAAAHRDPRVFPNPTTFDSSRDLSPAMPFGMGGHYCSGAALARLEISAAVGHFIEQFGDATLTHDHRTWDNDIFSRRPRGAVVRMRRPDKSPTTTAAYTEGNATQWS